MSASLRHFKRTFRMGARVIVNIASAASGAVIIASLVVVGVLFNDLNTLYSDVLNDMDDFKVVFYVTFFPSACFLQKKKKFILVAYCKISKGTTNV